MTGKVLPFTGEYYTREKRSEEICEALVVDLVEKMRNEHNFDISNQVFLKNVTWLIKFVEVIVDDELGVANELSRELKVL